MSQEKMSQSYYKIVIAIGNVSEEKVPPGQGENQSHVKVVNSQPAALLPQNSVVEYLVEELIKERRKNESEAGREQFLRGVLTPTIRGHSWVLMILYCSRIGSST